MSKKRSHLDIKVYFESLQLVDWQISGNITQGGQAQIIEVTNKQSKEQGVFRTLLRKEQKDVNRFNRELEILSTYRHQNVVQILDYTKDSDHQWYISKKGIRFETWWDTFLKRNSTPDIRLKEALRIVKELAQGLVYLHSKGIVHRDIKAKNVVVNGQTPVLIDFGVAFVPEEERFTDIDEAVSNLYSPDPTLHFMEEVLPWLDIFLLSQFFIWMISNGTNKPHIQRPLDWRWVRYPNFSDSNLLKIKAMTGQVGNFSTAPKNATEFLIFFNNIFSEDSAAKESDESVNIERTFKVIADEKLKKLIEEAENRLIIESRLSLFESRATELESGLNHLAQICGDPINFQKGNDGSIEKFLRCYKLDSVSYQTHYMSSYMYRAGKVPHAMTYEINYIMYTISGTQQSYHPKFKGFHDVPLIYLQTFSDNDKLRAAGMYNEYFILQEDDGSLKKYDGNMQYISRTSIPEIIELINQQITNPDLWRLVFS